MTGDEVRHVGRLRDHWWWRPGWRPGREFYTWHVTFDGQTELHRLVTTYQNALRAVPALDLVPRRWLHLTTQGVGFVDEVTPADLRAIVRTATRLLARLPPARVAFHRPVIRREAVALAPEPAQSLVDIRHTIREAIAATWDAGAVPEPRDGFEPHLSLAYANRDTSAAETIQALEDVHAEPVGIAVTRVSLIVLRRQAHLYSWDDFAQADLGDHERER